MPKASLSQLKFTRLDKKTGPFKRYVLAGPLLFASDEIGIYNGYLEEGDLIKVENVGAYCYNLAWEISYKKPKVIISKQS